MENMNSLFQCFYLVAPTLEIEVFPYPFFTFQSWNQLSFTFQGVIVSQWKRNLNSANLFKISNFVAFWNLNHLLILDLDGKFVEDTRKDIEVVR